MVFVNHGRPVSAYKIGPAIKFRQKTKTIFFRREWNVEFTQGHNLVIEDSTPLNLTWHPAVRSYPVVKSSSGRHVFRFHVDFTVCSWFRSLVYHGICPLWSISGIKKTADRLPVRFPIRLFVKNEVAHVFYIYIYIHIYIYE